MQSSHKGPKQSKGTNRSANQQIAANSQQLLGTKVGPPDLIIVYRVLHVWNMEVWPTLVFMSALYSRPKARNWVVCEVSSDSVSSTEYDGEILRNSAINIYNLPIMER